MVSVGDVIRIKACQEIFGQAICNVFYYLVATWTGNADLGNVLDEFLATVVGPVKTMQTPDLSYRNLRADNITNDLDFAELDGNWTGTYASSETQAPFIACGFRLSRTTKLTRPGAKRISGIAEEICNDGVVDPEAALFDDVKDALMATLPINSPGAGDGVLAPVIVGRNIDGSYDLSRLNPITGAVVQPNVTSQNSRKVGR